MKKAIAGAMLCFSMGANAAMIEMDVGGLYSPGYDYSGMGHGRGIGFDVTSDFHMTTLGMNLGVTSAATSFAYEFEIYDSVDGHSAGSLLDSRSFNLTEGEGWVDVAFDYDFLAGNSYVINFSRTDDLHLGSGLGTVYSWEPSSHFNYGVLSTVEGFEGADPDAYNDLSAHFRINTAVKTVPEPGTIALLALGLVGLGLSRKNKAR